MRKRIKRIISCLLVISLVSTLLSPVAAGAQTSTQTPPAAAECDPQTTPETGIQPQTTPETGTQPQTAPETGTQPQTAPETGTRPQTTPETGTQPQTAPETGTQPQTTPETGTQSQTPPAMDGDVLTPSTMDVPLNSTRNSGVTLSVVGPGGNEAGTAGEDVIHPLSRFKVTGESTYSQLWVQSGGSTSLIYAGSVNADTGLSGMVCQMGGFSNLVDGQQYTFYFGQSFITYDAKLTVTYQSAVPSDGLTVRNFTAEAGGDLMVDLSWDHPEAIPGGDSTWTYVLTASAAGSSSSVRLYQRDESGTVTTKTSLTVTGQTSATVAADPSLGPVTFVLTVSPGNNSSYSVRTSTAGPDPSGFTETVAPEVSIATGSLSGLTYTAGATVSDAWGTPSHALFTIQRNEEGTYTDTTAAGRADIPSPAFNSSGTTNTVKLDLSGLGAGTYRLKVVGYDTCGNPSDPDYGQDFTLEGTEKPLLTGLTVSGSSTGVTVDASNLAFSEEAIAQIWAEVEKLDISAYPGRPQNEEALRDALNALLKTADVRYTLRYYVGSSQKTLNQYVSAEGTAEAWDYSFPVGMTFKSGYPRLSGNLANDSIRPGGQYNFDVYLNFGSIEGYWGGTNSWVRQIGLDSWCVSAPASGGMSGDTAAPTAGGIQVSNPVAEGVFDSGSTFSVTASDDVLLQGGRFFWRKSGATQWNVGNSPNAAAGTGNDVTFTITVSSLFGGSALTRGSYDIRFLGVDWAGRTAEQIQTLTYGTLDAPASISVTVAENAATITWDEVPGAAGYRVYVNGTALKTDVTGNSYTYYMEPCGENTPEYQKEQYAFAVAAVTAAGGLGEQGVYSQIVTPQPDTTAPNVTGVSSQYEDSEYRFTLTGWDNGRVRSYSWQLLPAEDTGDAVLLEGARTYNYAYGTAIQGTIHGETTISEWLNTKNVLQNSYRLGINYTYAVRTFPGGGPDPTYFTPNGEGTTYTLKDGSYRLRVYVYDSAGNPSAAYDHPFEVANVGPALPDNFTHSAEVTLSTYSSVTYSWQNAPEGSPGIRLWCPKSDNGYATAAERDAAVEELRASGDPTTLPDTPGYTGQYTIVNVKAEDGSSYTSNNLSAGKYYLYAIAAYNEYGNIGTFQVGTFDTCYEGEKLETTAVTYGDQDIKETGGEDLEQGQTLSVTVTAGFIRGGSAILCRTVNGEEVRLTGYPSVSFTKQEDGSYAATLTCKIPANDFSWSGPQDVYVRLDNSSYQHIRTGDIPVGLKILPDDEAPNLSGVTPAPGAGISGDAFPFTLNATDNSGVIAGAKVWWSPYTGEENWTPITEGVTWNGSVLTLDTTKLTADATGNLKLKFTVTDGAGNESNAVSGGYALANSPIAAPTGLNVNAGERQITLAWNTVGRLDVAGYRVYRAVDSGEYVQVAEISKEAGNTFTDTDNGGYLDPTRAYSYQVAAYSTANEDGERSVATGWLHPEEQQGAPTILSLEPWQGSAFRSPVTVTAKVEDEIEVKEVKLEFAWLGASSMAEPDSSTVWQPIQTFDGPSPDAEGGKTYTLTAQWTLDEAAQTEEWYALRVTARNNSEKVAVSTVKCRYDNQAPDPVTGLSAADEGSGGAILLNFTASASPDVQKYRIYRSENADGLAAALENDPIGETAAGAYRDSTCEKGKTYYYWVTAVDRAGNESQATGPVSERAGAECDVAIVQPPVSRDSVLTVGRAGTIAVSVRNAGPARAGGTLTLTADYGGGAQTVGSVTFGESGDYALLRAGETREILFTLTPVEGEKVTLSAAFASDGEATDTNPDNNTMGTDALPLNHAPAAVWNLKDDALTCDSGETVALTAEGSTDADGDQLTYLWEVGGESKTGMAVSHRFMTPGSYPVTLTATDEKGAATVLTGTVTVADNRPDLYVDSITVERRGGEDEDYSAVTGDRPIQEGDAVKVTAVIGNHGPGPVPADMSFLTSLIRNGTSLGYQTLTGLEKDETKTVTFHYTAAAGAQVLKVVTNDILQVISEPDMTNNVLTVQYNAEQVEFADIAVTNLNWQNLNNPDSTSFTTQDQVIWSAAVENKGDADATFTLTLYVDGQVAAQRQVFRAVGASGVESFAIAPTAGVHTVTLTAGGELMDRDESNNSATVETDAFTVAVPELTLSEITIEPGNTADPVQGSTLRFTARVSSAVNITVPFSVTFEVDGKPLKTVQLDRTPGSNTVLQAGQPVDVFAEWVVADGSHTVTVTADPDRAVVDAPVVQTARTLDLTVRKPDLWLSDVYNAPADTLDYGGEAKFTVRVSNRSTATLFDKYALVVSAARWADKDTEPAETAYEAVSRTQYNGIQGNSTSIQILSFKPEHSGKYSVRVSLEPVGSADFDTTYYQPYTFTYTVRNGMTLTTSPNKDGESNDYGANMFLESQHTIPVKASAKMADGTVPTATDGLSITASILGTDKQVNLADGGEGNFSAELPVSGLATQNYTLRFDGVYGGYSATYETQIVFVQDVQGSLSVSDGTTTVQTVDGEEPGLPVAAGTPVTITGTVTQGDGDPYTGTIVLELDLLPSYQQQPDGTVVEGSAEGVITWYRGQKIIFIAPETAEDRADMTYDTETGTFTYTFTPQAKESGKWAVRAYAYDRLMGTDITGTAFTVYGMEPSPSETVVTMTKGSNLDTGSVTLNLHNAAWGGTFGKLTGVTAVLENGSAYPGVTVTLDQGGFEKDLPVSKDALSIPVSITTTADAPDYAEYTVTFSAVSNDGGSSVNVSARTVLKLYLRPATAAPKATPANVVVSANPGDTITRTVTVKNNGTGAWEGITIQQPGLSFIRADNLSKTAIGQWESLTFDITFAPLSSTQLGRYQDKVVLKNEEGNVTCTIPVALEVTALDTGTATFQVTSDLGDEVKNAQIKLYGKDPQIQIINGVETEYYLNYSLTTDENGLAVLEGKPAGAYDYVITAQGMETYEGVLELMPGLSGQAEAVTLTTLPVQITWTVTETTIVDQYDIKLNIDMGVTIPTPKLGSTTPWFTVPKQVDNPITLTTNIVNNSLVDVYDVSARIDGTNTGISVVGGGYIGTIPAMSYKTVQIVVSEGYYELASRPSAHAALQVTGSYLSYDADGLPEMPAKTLSLGVGIYNPGTSKVTVDTLADGLDLEEKLELSLPEDVDVSELEYLLLWDGELGTQKPERPDGGSVMELVKMELSQTASLERQAFDATLTVTNNYTGNITLQGLTANVVVERVEDDGTVTDATALMYILPQRTAPSILQPGETATLTWKLIPGEGMGGTDGIQYQVRADVGYTVVTPGEGENPGASKPVQTSTQAVEITVQPQPSLTVDYFLPHKVYPNVPFNLEVVVKNSGYGAARNVVLDSSQLEIVENKSGLVGTWQIVDTSFGASSGSSFRVTLGDVGAGATVKGWYTIRWELPTAAGELGDDVYGEVLNFTASLTHRTYEGVELNPLITAVYTHIVGKDEVTLQEEGQESQTVKVIMGNHGLPAFFWNMETGLRIPLYVPRAVSDGTLEGDTYTFTAPERAETPDTTDARHAVLMIGEVEAMTGIPVSAVYRYDNAAMTGTPVTLSHGNYWKDTYKNAEGKDTDYLYIVDELLLVDGKVQPRYYKVVYGSGVELKEPETSQILYDENGERTAVLGETGRNHELGDDVPAQISVKAVNNSGNTEEVTVYFYAARYVNGEAQEYKYLGSVGPQTLAPDASADFTYTWELGLTNPNRPTIAGTYRVKMTTLGAGLSGEMAASAPGVTADITFNAAPIADAGVDFTVDYGQPAVFDGTRSYDPDGGALVLYVWDFGDGQSGLGPTPSHAYQASGSYIATLYVMDDNGAENALDKTAWEDGRPTTSQAVHDVMVTVEETRPDLILPINNGLTITNDKSGGFSEEDEVTLHATITNDKENPVTDNFIATLYVDNVYQGYQRINLYDNGGDGKLEQDETVTVDFTYTMPDSYSHVATVKVNDVSLTVDEADLRNNQRSIVILGSAGVSAFPDLELSNVQVGGVAADSNGAVRPVGGAFQLNAGEALTITAMVENVGKVASEPTAVILYADGEYAGMAALGALECEESETVTISFVPEASGSYTFTLLADGPTAKLAETNKANNELTVKTALITVAYPDLTITGLSAGEAADGYKLTATVENQGDAPCPAGLEVAFYAGGRYVGAAQTGSGLAAGGRTQVTLTWTDVTDAEVLGAVVNQGGRIPEFNQLNNTFTQAEGVSITAPARPTLAVTGVTTAEPLTYGHPATASVTIENTGAGSAGAFTVSLYLNGALVGSAPCGGLTAEESTTVTVDWTPDQTPTGEMTLTAVADSAYQVVMDSRDGVVMDSTVTVGRGILVELDHPGTLTQNNQNVLTARVIDSETGLTTFVARPGQLEGEAAEQYDYTVDVTFYLDGQLLGQGEFDPAAGAYRLNADLSSMATGNKTLKAAAVLTDAKDGSFTGEAQQTVTLAAPVGITLAASQTVLAAGDSLTLSGTTQNVNEGAIVTLTLVGGSVYSYTATVDSEGKYALNIALPGGLGGAVTASASVTENGITKMASQALSVYGAYVTLPARLTLTQGQARQVSGQAANIGYTDLTDVTLRATGVPAGFTVKFQGTGGVYEIPGSTGVTSELLDLTANAVVINGAEPEYDALDFALEIAADASVTPGDYPLTFTLTGTTGEPNEGMSVSRTVTVNVTVRAAQAVLELDTGDEERPGTVVRAIRPGQTVAALVRLWNAGDGDLTDIQVTAPDLPWVNLAIAGLGEDATLKPYQNTAQRMSIQVIAAPTEKVEAGTYTGEVIITARSNGTPMERRIPVTFHVSAAQIGTAVLELWDEDSVPVPEGATVSLYGPAEAAQPQLYTETLGGYGRVQLTNYPAGTYTLTFRADGYETLEQTFTLYPTIDLNPQRVTVKPKMFELSLTAGTSSDLYLVTGANQAFYDIAYQLTTEPTTQAGLAFNYPADEFEASYTLNRVASRLSVRNSCLESTGALDEILYDVTFTLESGEEDYADLITFRGENGSVSSITLDELVPGQQLDLVWEVAESALYVRAGVAEVEGSPNTYTLTLPAGCGLVWSGEAGMFPTWSMENGGQYILTGVSADGRTATVLAKTNAEGITAPAPDGRVPRVQLVDQDGQFIAGGWYLDFTLKATGIRRLGDDLSQTVTRTIPLRVSYVSRDYYLAADSGQLALDVRLEGAFPALSGAGYKYFSQDFLTYAQVGAGQTGSGDGFSLGFAQNAAYEKETQVLQVGFDNPSKLEKIENLTFRVLVSDQMPQEGQLAAGALLKNETFMVTANLDGLTGAVENPDGSITIPEVAAGGGVDLSFLMTPTVDLVDSAIIDIYVEEGLLTREEGDAAMAWLESLSGDYYAWISYSFTRNGETYTGYTPAVGQSARTAAQVVSSYDILAGEGNAWYIDAVFTNLGDSPAKDVILETPVLPVVDGVQVQLLAGTWVREGEEYPADWESQPYDGELAVGQIDGGETIYARYKLLVLDGTRNNAAIAFSQGDAASQMNAAPLLLSRGGSDTVLRSSDAYDEYRDQLMRETAQAWGVSNATNYKTITIQQLSGGALASRSQIQTVVRLLKLLNADPDEDNNTLLANILSDPEIPADLKSLLSGANQNGGYGMESLYDVTVEKYGYSLGDYDYAIASLQDWDSRIAKTDFTTGILSIVASMGIKLNESYRVAKLAGKVGQEMAEALAKTLYDETIGGVSSFWKSVANGDILKNLRNISFMFKHQENFQVLSATGSNLVSKSTAAIGFDTRMMYWDWWKSGQLYGESGGKVFNLYGVTLSNGKTLSTALNDRQAAMVAVNAASKEYKAAVVALSKVTGTTSLDDIKTMEETALKAYDKLKASAQSLQSTWLDANEIRTIAKDCYNTEEAAAFVSQLDIRMNETDKVVKQILGQGSSFDTEVKLFTASLKEYQTIEKGRGDFVTSFGSTTGIIKEIYMCFRVGRDASESGDWGALKSQVVQSMGNTGVGYNPILSMILSLGISAIQSAYIDPLIAAKNEKVSAEASKVLLDLYQAAANYIHKTYYRGSYTIDAADLAGKFADLITDIKSFSFQALTAEEKEAYVKQLTGELTVLIGSDTLNRKISGKTDIYSDPLFNRVMNFLLGKAVERVLLYSQTDADALAVLRSMSPNSTEEDLYQALMDQMVSLQTIRQARDNASQAMEGAIEKTEAMLGNGWTSSYPAGAMIDYLSGLNSYILRVDDSGRRVLSLTPIQVYGPGERSGKDAVTSATLSFNDLAKAIIQQNSSLDGLYTQANDAVKFYNENILFRYGLVGVDVAGTLVSTYGNTLVGAVIGASSIAMSAFYDIYSFNWSNDHQKAAEQATGVAQANMVKTVGALTQALDGEAAALNNTAGLFDMLADWNGKDPALPVSLLSFSAGDVETAAGQSTGTGQFYLSFRNDHTAAVEVQPSIQIFTDRGIVLNFDAETMYLPAGETGIQTVSFLLPDSSLADDGGYTALLTWKVSQDTSMTISETQGPALAHFWVGQRAALDAVRTGSGYRTGLIVSTAGDGGEALTAAGTYTVADGTRQLRFALGALPASGATLTVKGPTEAAVTRSYINANDYWIIQNPAAGTYTVTAAAPAGYTGQLLVEAMAFTPDGAQVDAWAGSDTLTIGKDLRGSTTSGIAELFVTETGFGGKDAGNVSFALTDEAGEPWSQSGLTWSFLGQPDRNTAGSSDPQLAAAGGTLTAGGMVNATLLVASDGTELTDGSYPAWITITVEQGSADSLRSGDGQWTIADDGSATWRMPITILVDRAIPAAPADVTAQDQGDGTTLVTGTAQPGQLVGVALTTDAGKIGQEEGAAVMAGVTTADETTGRFQLTVTTPADGQILVPFAASATGTLSLAAEAAVEEPAEKTQITVTAPENVTKTYDGTPVQVSAAAGDYPGALEYVWRTAGGEPLTGAPRDAGSYTVTVRVPESDSKYTSNAVSVSVTIDPAPGSSDPAYREPDSLAADCGAALSTVALPSGWAWADGSQSLTATGVYQATYTPENPNYAPVDVGLTVNVNPPAGKIQVTITGLTVSDKTYDGEPIKYEGTPSVTGGYTGGLTYTWKKSDGTPLIGAPADAGSYTLTVSVPEDSICFGSTVLSFTIAKAPAASDPAYQEPTGLTGTAGSALSTVTLPGGWSWNSPATVLKEGQNSYNATYTPTNANYQSVSTPLNVTATQSSQGGGDEGSGSGGGSGGGGGALPEEPDEETVTNPDGSTTTTVTKPDGTVTETTTYPDGTTTTTDTKPDGTVTETTTKPDGTTGTAQADPEGNTTAQVEISQEGAAQAEQTGQPVELPLPGLVPGSGSGSAPTVEIILPGDAQTVTVKIPVENAAPGVVAVLVDQDGTETVLKQSIATGDGVLLTLEGSSVIRIVDNTQSFSDVDENAWYSEAVAFVTARDIFSGTGGGIFDPDGIMTRGMQAKVLHNMENNPAAGVTNIFPDVQPGIWYADAVHWAAEQGVVTGYDNGLYGPDDSITREQLATILWRYAGKPESTHSLEHFADADQISGYACQAMAWANENGIINGTGDGRLAPQGTALRSQVAQMLMNYCKYSAK